MIDISEENKRIRVSVSNSSLERVPGNWNIFSQVQVLVERYSEHAVCFEPIDPDSFHKEMFEWEILEISEENWNKLREEVKCLK